MIFHPFTVFIPTLVVVLKDTSIEQAVAWILFLAVVILVPALLLIHRARRRQRYTYQRKMRHVLYLTFWVSMAVCLGLGLSLDAPRRLMFSLLCLVIWVPFQSAVNARFTKISAHTAVIAGIASALVAMGELNTVPLVLGAAAVVLAVGWARMVTGNHTLQQVSLGILVSVAAVLAAWGIMRPL
jgi:membrane-associated phospholipid phosphatase